MITTEDPAVAWATALWERLASSFLDAQNAIVAIIDGKAWEPLGYESFEKAWVDKMSGLTLAAELQPTVVYQLLSEGLDPDQIAEIVKGVGPEVAKNLARERDNGVPAAAARGRRSTPRPKSDRTTLFLHLGRERFRTWSAEAAQQDKSLEDLALDILSKHFES